MSVMIAFLFRVVDHVAILIGLIEIESSDFRPKHFTYCVQDNMAKLCCENLVRK